MSGHQGMLEGLAKDRDSSRYRQTTPHQGDLESASRGTDSSVGALNATRARAGWMLVAIGLRLALHSDRNQRMTTQLGR